ncbi:radical SAM protein [Dyadobacter chenwenxiniae]|uniref:Radical SAM protein n=2 Tax=Dyadobacter chenwenxiniae TaxID=2906456 RepID=A0A9X1TDU6_9BACT|nr:radical SAM protein [Dyadobacter chenwenxiniae]MCF0061332.1 radical SAM protein [Dyadobacter chenwenxiniae]UON81154.1 radical SAM protein [Dyadobacter chenwenxiniae]
MIPRRAPELLLRPIDEEHAYAVNCAVPGSFRILNKVQYEILNAVNGRDPLAVLSMRTGVNTETLERFLIMLSRTEIVRFDDHFSVPQKTLQPKSLNFWIHTTNACNLGCSYCYIATLNNGKGMSEHVRNQLLHKLEETVRNRKIRHVKFRLAGGEPLSQFRAWQTFIPVARERLQQFGCVIDFSFLTNLTMLNEEMVEFSKQHNIGYGVSIDGVGDRHDATRKFRSGKGSFPVVDTNLRKLVLNGISVSVTTVISNQNLTALPELTRYLIALDVPFRYSIVKGETIDAVSLEAYLSASYGIMGEAIDIGWQFSRRHQFCDLKPNELGFQTCASGFSGGAIDVDGSLKYCHVHFGDESERSHSIFDPSLDLVDMIEQGSHYEDDRSGDCLKCRYRFVCTSGCPVYRVDQKDPQCSIYHKFIPKIYELQARERLNSLHKNENI